MVTVLVVDDTALMRSVMRTLLEKAGHKVVADASNGEMAVKLYKILKPDIVLMDIMMPNKDGIDALKRIIDLDRNAKVIMCTTAGNKEQVAKALKEGAKDFLVKPITAERLLNSIDKVAREGKKSVGSMLLDLLK
jgi:two-component system chemotaxis response regulator CheY